MNEECSQFIGPNLHLAETQRINAQPVSPSHGVHGVNFPGVVATVQVRVITRIIIIAVPPGTSVIY